AALGRDPIRRYPPVREEIDEKALGRRRPLRLRAALGEALEERQRDERPRSAEEHTARRSLGHGSASMERIRNAGVTTIRSMSLSRLSPSSTSSPSMASSVALSASEVARPTA